MHALESMRSWQLIGKESIRIEELPIPEPGVREVLVRVQACGICSHSDLCYFLYCGERPGCSPRKPFGHEMSGYIQKVGAGVRRWAAGDRVFARTVQKTSGLSEFCIVAEKHLGKLPERFTYIQGAALQQLPIAVHATRMCGPGDTVAILG